jgi:hypothetical protein
MVGDSDISSGLELAEISCSLVSPDRVQMKAKWVLFVAGGVCGIEGFAVLRP